MNEFVELPVVPTRNSLITIGSVLRTASLEVTDWLLPSWAVQVAVPFRSPLNDWLPDVTLKVALTLAPGATDANEVWLPPATVDCQPVGTDNCRFTFVAADAAVLVNVKVDCCDEPGLNVCNPVGCAVSDAGVNDNCC